MRGLATSTGRCALALCLSAGLAQVRAAPASGHRSTLDRFCVGCHSGDSAPGDLRLDRADLAAVHDAPELWERVVHKLRTGTMPPPNMPRPPVADREVLLDWLEASLDTAALRSPTPGRTEGLRRLNRTEYQNAVRDLLAVEIDAKALLPQDESGHGFDNVNLSDLSPMLLGRYISAAQQISRLAVGSGQVEPHSDIIRVKPDVTQEQHVPGLPLGSRGGVSVTHAFVQDGEYEIQIWLSRNRNEEIEGLRREHDVHLLLDRQRIETFTVRPPTDRFDYSQVDKHLRKRVAVTAGPHQLAVTFPKTESSLLETMRQPTQSRFNMHRHPRTAPAVFQISVTGPYSGRSPEDTPSRRRLFTCRPAGSADEADCATEILSTLLRRAYRRPVSDEDLLRPLEFFRKGRQNGGFDAGIERALTAVLVSPEFLFRTEAAAPGSPGRGAARISPVELASRMSFFLWSSIPDDELLAAAASGELGSDEGLERQVRRMLADPRAANFATNFAGQWLRLRSLESFSPDARLFPDFDDNLRQALRRETELFVQSIVSEDRSVLDLIKADYTYLNERLSKHYGIGGVYGTRFRRVALASASKRGGLLRHGSVLTVTSYPTRTSPVLRGTWVLENIFGAPPPPPPPNVPELDNAVSASLPMRERLSAHRDNPACASCHQTIDPVGFALENFDALGRWRDYQDGVEVDAAGGLPGAGESAHGVADLERTLLSRPELFVGTLTRKLLTFALGRGVEYYDAPAVRQILRDAKPRGYRFSDLVLGIVKSVPFVMRSST
ncbi:MAG: DUF1592 domain-containing protein [Bryobacterales bacterium]|nr:DUF1592 domain-containing protein [Bryobacterales bacterium]MDE0261316.1 DUF1592 domain-containing protein [Bryobacterales bacterium]MDE0621196.1 DUF1592 domain-containing protein [Bryobacterales bacterium]